MRAPGVEAGKVAWRRWARGLPPVEPAVGSDVVEHLREFLDGVSGPVCGYLALPDEVDIGPAIDDPTVGVRWVLPRVDDSGVMHLHVDDGRRTRNAFGLDEPVPECDIVPPEALSMVLVPGRVFDRRGFRLGRGGGHYDRLLPRLAVSTPVVGVVWSERIVDAIPVEGHDRAMTHLATEHGVAAVGP